MTRSLILTNTPSAGPTNPCVSTTSIPGISSVCRSDHRTSLGNCQRLEKTPGKPNSWTRAGMSAVPRILLLRFLLFSSGRDVHTRIPSGLGGQTAFDNKFQSPGTTFITPSFIRCRHVFFDTSCFYRKEASCREGSCVFFPSRTTTSLAETPPLLPRHAALAGDFSNETDKQCLQSALYIFCLMNSSGEVKSFVQRGDQAMTRCL